MKAKEETKTTLIIFCSNKKEALQIAKRDYGETVRYLKPYRYLSKGNNFYEFEFLKN